MRVSVYGCTCVDTRDIQSTMKYTQILNLISYQTTSPGNVCGNGCTKKNDERKLLTFMLDDNKRYYRGT